MEIWSAYARTMNWGARFSWAVILIASLAFIFSIVLIATGLEVAFLLSIFAFGVFVFGIGCLAAAERFR